MPEQEEIWKVYPDYPFIEVSNLGRVITKDRTVIRSDGRKQFVEGRILKQQFHKNGYVFVEFGANGKQINLSVHRAVAICFIPNPNNLPEVNHIDNDKTNNSASNLEWCSRKYNETYKKNFGTSPAQVLGRPVIAVNQETSEVSWFETQSEAVRKLSVNKGNMNEVVNGKRNRAGGFWFCNADENAVERARAKFGDEIAEKVEKLISENKKVLKSC